MWCVARGRPEGWLKPQVESLRYFRHPFLHAGMSPEIQMANV